MVKDRAAEFGTEKNPLPQYMRKYFSELIKSPRKPSKTISDDMQASGEKNGAASVSSISIEDSHKIRINGKWHENLMQLRVCFSPLKLKRKRREFAGTSFIEVKLENTTSNGTLAFEESIKTIPGVIEWDQVRGDDFDYLLRVVNLGNSLSIKEPIMDLPSVKSASFSRIHIMKSGIVDNFSPDDFLAISESPISKVNNS